MIKIISIISIFVIFSNNIKGQVNNCECLYNSNIDSVSYPVYGNNNNEINDFIIYNILPILYVNSDSIPDESITMLFIITISDSGKVICVDDLYYNLDTLYLDKIKNEFFKMKNWVPAKKNGINICFKYLFPIILKI